MILTIIGYSFIVTFINASLSLHLLVVKDISTYEKFTKFMGFNVHI